MKLINSSYFPTPFLRRMLMWCIKEVDVPKNPSTGKRLLRARFTKCSDSYRGWACGGAILVRIGNESNFPVNVAWRKCYQTETLKERFLTQIQTLVSITCHELAHIRLARINKANNNELNAETIARSALDTFISKEAELRAAWSQSSPVAPPITP